MEGFLALLLMLAILAACSIPLKVMGSRAENFIFIEIRELSIDQIVDIGTKASGSFMRRIAGGRIPVQDNGDGSIEWDIAGNNGTMKISIIPLSDGDGYQVGGAATELTIAQMGAHYHATSVAGKIWMASMSMSNAFCRSIQLPRNPGTLLRQRGRVLRAVLAAERSVVSPESTS